MTLPFGPRRAEYHVISSSVSLQEAGITAEELKNFERFDTIYRSLCAALYNYAPLSGHPGGSISSGRIVAALLYDLLKYDFLNPDREDADILSYAAGHKALGLYSHWALRDEIIRIAAPQLLPADIKYRLRLEDLPGFRRNPVNNTPLFRKFQSKPLDGHPTPATPFLRLSTGASGVGIASSIGLAFAAADYYGKNAPKINIVEGEGGLTPGRVSEALAAAGTASLHNVILHIDWNQASIDSEKVCREGSKPGDYVQWDPCELAYMHDWNVISVEDGMDFNQIFSAQRKALAISNDQPTAIVYRTVKGWNYGMEGKKSHGAGHPLCSAGFYNAIKPLLDLTGKDIELCKDEQECRGGTNLAMVEECFWDALLIIREVLEKNKQVTSFLARQLLYSQTELNRMGRKQRNGAPDISKVYRTSPIPLPALLLQPGTTTTLRNELGKVLHFYNKESGGSLFTSAADLLGSTSVNIIGQGFGDGYFNVKTNPSSRTLSIGGICEDAMAGIMSGISSYGKHIGVCSSYGAFIAALGHIAARLHAIGGQARKVIADEPYNPFFLICAHAGIKTGEDGPTHADPQPLQLVQENFPRGTLITLTPWDPQEIWYLVSETFCKRPAVIVPFVTRPNETIIDRNSAGLEPATASIKGVYQLLKSKKKNPDCAIVLQGSEVAYEFVSRALPVLRRKKIDVAAWYVSSAELFDLLPGKEQEKIFPEKIARQAMGITGFTLPTMYRWILSSAGRKHTLYPFKKGHFLGSGKAESVIAEAGLDGESQYRSIVEFIRNKK
ncbi:MAG: hypothetical protein HYY40_02785 [Bacteroidetes bacterium]|nr:hypothetical protein [Bacteroidota bacterium]